MTISMLCNGYMKTKLTQCKTLTQTNNHTACNKASNVSTGAESLHQCSNDDEQRASSHADSTSRKIGERATQKESCHDSTYGVGCVDGPDNVGAGFVEVGIPVL